MDKPNITKGEWESLDTGFEIAICVGEKKITQFQPSYDFWEVPEQEVIANAKATSAVPDMIDALIEADDYIYQTRHQGYTDERDYRELSQLIEEALKKAGVES